MAIGAITRTGFLAPGMYLLALDTATNSGGVALSRNAEVIALLMLKTPLRYQEKILDGVDFLLGQHHLKLGDVDAFATATGPGSFTGIRIGLATVKAFAQPLDKPTIGVSTLEALAYRFRTVHPRVGPWIDARRQQVFAALYEFAGHSTRNLMEETVAKPADWLDRLSVQDCLFVGDGARHYRSCIESMESSHRVLDTDNRILEELCQLAFQRFQRGGQHSVHSLQAQYLRPSDAELGRKQAPSC